MNRTSVETNTGVRMVLVVALLGTIVLVMSSWFFLSMGKFTDGALCMPLDDSFIYFQYARNFAEGRPFHYSETDEPSTGATSLPYTLILAAGYKLGARGDSIIVFAFVLGACFLLASSLLVAKILRMFNTGVASIGGAVLLLTNGHVVWAYLSGMEVGLFATTILLTLFFFFKEKQTGRFYGTSVAAALMGFSRPEGVFLALPVALFVFLGSRGQHRPLRLLFASICLAGGIQFLLNALLTGSLASTGTQAKSVFYTQEPDLLRLYILRFFRLAREVFLLFLSDFNSLSLGPQWARFSALFLRCGFLAALVVFFLDRTRRTSGAPLLVSWVVLSVFLSLVPWAWNVHQNRYEVPFFPIFLVMSSAGLGILATYTPRRFRVFSQLAVAIIFGLVAVSFLGTARRMARVYAHNCENIFHQQVRVGRWLNLYTAPDAVVGLNDAGAIAYYGRRRVYDFVGIVTNGEAVNWRSGIGSVVEALERLPRERLPRFLAIYPDWLPFLVSSGIARTQVFRAHLDLNTICGGSDKVVYLPDWTLLKSGHNPPSTVASEGRTLVDSLDVADLLSEKQHGYRPLKTWRPEARVLSDSAGTRIMDGGRRLFAGETMNVNCVAGKELLVVSRLDGGTSPLDLYIDGKIVGSATLENPMGGWFYASFTVPAEWVRREHITVTVRQKFSGTQSYGSYHYWFFQ